MLLPECRISNVMEYYHSFFVAPTSKRTIRVESRNGLVLSFEIHLSAASSLVDSSDRQRFTEKYLVALRLLFTSKLEHRMANGLSIFETGRLQQSVVIWRPPEDVSDHASTGASVMDYPSLPPMEIR
jgi:hypothetical protein